MQFFTVARIYRDPTDAISLRDVWMITEGEMNTAAGVALQHLQNEKELAEPHREVAWLAQALIEFMDLADFTFQGKGRRQRKNFLYFESISALREATLGMLNGAPRASTGLLRSVLEMLLLHCWWQKQISRTGSSNKFYDWLEGRRQKPKFWDVVKGNFNFLGIPADPEAEEQIKQTYNQLCSYVHAPLIKESFTTLNQGNLGQVGIPVLQHWLILARDTLRIALDQFVHLHPQSLFPVDVVRKFGFNPPMGMYFDNFSFVSLMAVFGTAQIETYRARLKDHDSVKLATQLYESRPELSREQILETWSDEDGNETAVDATDDLVGLWFRTKAQMRVASWLASYADPLGPNW